MNEYEKKLKECFKEFLYQENEHTQNNLDDMIYSINELLKIHHCVINELLNKSKMDE